MIMFDRNSKSVRKNWCETGKTRFKDHKQAIESIRHFERNSERDVIPVRAYKCQLCNGWHLTSKEDLFRSDLDAN